MTNDGDARREHPDELLAGYVDGSASREERRTVETHLMGCSKCREEVALARMGRTAIVSLPELQAPGLASAGIGALLEREEPAEKQPERMPLAAGVGAKAKDELADRRAARREARQRRPWQGSWAALAGVAAVLAILAVIPLVLTRSGGPKQATGGAAAPTPAPAEAASYPPVLDRSADYDQASLKALARQLGEQARRGAFSENRTSSGPAGAPLSGATPQAASVKAADVVRCAIRGTGLPAGTVPVYLETASYQGTPAFVVAVQAEGGSRSHLRVYAVSRQDCTFLFEADQPV